MSATDLFRATGAKRILVGLSGGKDSLVLLDLAVTHFGTENVEAFFMQLVKGIRCELDPIERAVRRYPGLTLHVVPHWALSGYVRRHYLMVPVAGTPPRNVKQKDVEDHLRRKTGIDWVATGQRETESVVRMAMLRQCQGIQPDHHRVYPIWKWKTAAVFAYLRAKHIPVPPPLAVKRAGQSGGIDVTPFGLAWLLEHHPEDFKRLEQVFPFARAAVMKHQQTASVARGAVVDTPASTERPERTGDAGTTP